MRCSYCFYRDVAEHRKQAFEGMLSLEQMEHIIRSAMEYADGMCSFTFQGGEPTLAGLDFYREVVRLEEKHRKSGVQIQNAIQTNGYCINAEWARFLAEKQFLVGLSLDGPSRLHNLNRVDMAGKGTFNTLMQTVRLFDKWNVTYNILCVVTGQNARSITQIYHFYKKCGFRWLQFIPCLEPLEQERGTEKYHLSVEKYGEFLIRIFDLWFADLCHGEYISIRHLDNWLSILLGEQPEACNMTGRCAVQFVVEGDGGVYPCDFYVLDEWRLGTVGQCSFSQMQNSETAQRFIAASLHIPESCKSCRYFPICRNGCRRDRMLTSTAIDINYYCKAYDRFFSERGKQLQQAANMIMSMRHARSSPPEIKLLRQRF